MHRSPLDPEDTGLEVIDLRLDTEFAKRPLHPRSATQMEGILRLYDVFLERPADILQELVSVAVELCGADSAGISIEQPESGEDNFWLWVAVAGEYERFANATLPRYPSACGICLERRGPQQLRVTPRFFERIGVEAETVTDGILLPWQSGGTRGTLWILAHGRYEAFDSVDLETVQNLADFTAGVLRTRARRANTAEDSTAGNALALAKHLAEQVNDQLRLLSELLHLSVSEAAGDGKVMTSAERQKLFEDFLEMRHGRELAN